MSRCIDLTGMRFGRLYVIKKSERRNKNRNVQWDCKCSCGTILTVEGINLRNGHTKSCGCLQKEMASASNKKVNKFELLQDYGIGYTTNTNSCFMFDLDDFEIIKNSTWFESDQGYVLTRDKTGRFIRLHRYVMGLGENDSPIIDHINRNKMDNRKCNLRITNKQLNGINRGCNINNRIGHKGIQQCKNGKFVARIVRNGKDIYIGCFKELKDAITAREEKEVELFGEFAYKELCTVSSTQ
jgi:hypothetical protein